VQAIIASKITML